jgi:SAM-dependent methyltransferase
MDRSMTEAHARLEDNHWWFRGRRAVVRAVLERWLPEGAHHILDVGSGTGAMPELLTRFGSVVGVEPSPLAAEVARARLGDRADVRTGDVPKALKPGERFDVLTMFDVLEHLDDPVGTLASLQPYLAPGATVVVTVPAFELLWSRHDDLSQHRRRYRRAQLVDQLTAAGLQVQHSAYYNSLLFLPAALTRLGRRALAIDDNDLELSTGPFNRLLAAVFSSERGFVPRFSPPFGLSVVAVAKRVG